MTFRTALIVLGVLTVIAVSLAQAQIGNDPIINEDVYYPGVYLGGGPEETWLTPKAYFDFTWGKQQVKYLSRYISLAKDCLPDGLIAGGVSYFNDSVYVDDTRTRKYDVVPVVFLRPDVDLETLQDTLAPDFSPYKVALDNFREYCSNNLSEKERIIVVFGHEMNGHWYKWGQRPALYVQSFRNVANILRRTGSNIRMCWMPNQGWGYPAFGAPVTKWDPSGMKSADSTVFGNSTNPDTTAQEKSYKHYYPGPEYVDWVGLTNYGWNADSLKAPNGRWLFIAGIESPVNFYKTYSQGELYPARPMIIGETSFFDATIAESELIDLQRKWLGMVYSCEVKTRFPNLKVAIWFNVKKPEEEQLRDFRIGRDGAVSYQAYIETVKVTNCVTLLPVHNPVVPSTCEISIHPNPGRSSSITIMIKDNARQSGIVRIVDVVGRRIMIDGADRNFHSGFTVNIADLRPGVYFLIYQSGKQVERRKFIVN